MACPAEKDGEGGKKEAHEERERKGELTPIIRTLTQEKMTAYSEDSANAERGQSIHVQPEVAKAAGFERTVAQGLMAADYLSELVTAEGSRLASRSRGGLGWRGRDRGSGPGPEAGSGSAAVQERTQRSDWNSATPPRPSVEPSRASPGGRCGH